MIAALVIALQAAPAAPADIALHATVTARQVKVESKGRAEVRAWAEPDAGSTAQSSGSRQSRRFELRIDARIADLMAGSGESGISEETGAPPPR